MVLYRESGAGGGGGKLGLKGSNSCINVELSWLNKNGTHSSKKY